MGKLTNVITGLFNKANDTEARYEKAVEAKTETVIKLQAELAELSSGLRELHKMKVLNQVSAETYEVENAKAEALQKQIDELQEEIILMNEYKLEDIYQVLEEIEEKKLEVSAERQKEVHALKVELLQAKHEYLSKMIDARNRYHKIVASEHRVEAIKAKLGMKNRLDYLQGADDALSMYSVAGADYISLEVDRKEVHDALYYNRIGYQLQNELQKHGKLEK